MKTFSPCHFCRLSQGDKAVSTKKWQWQKYRKSADERGNIPDTNLILNIWCTSPRITGPGRIFMFLGHTLFPYIKYFKTKSHNVFPMVGYPQEVSIMATSIQLIWKLYSFSGKHFHLFWIPIQRTLPNQLETVSKQNGNSFHFGNMFPNQIETVSILEIVSKSNRHFCSSRLILVKQREAISSIKHLSTNNTNCPSVC